MNRFIIILFSIFLTYLNYKIYNSNVVQTKITADFNSRNYKQENFKILQNTDIEFPNLSATAFPMYALLANYYLMYGDIDQSLKILDRFSNINPYLRVNESLKAEAYFRLGVRDSSYHYAKIAHENLPLNARHFQQYLAELTWRKDIEEINKVFLTSRAKNNPEFWLFYFSSVINLKSENDQKIDSLAGVALEKFPTNQRIKTIAGYILFGQEEIKKSYVLNQEAISNFENSNFEGAAEKFILAAQLNPIDYSFNENAGMSLIKSGEYEKAIVYLKRALSSADKKDDGKSEYGLGLCLKEMNEKVESCFYLKKAMEKNYKPAFFLATSVCIDKIILKLIEIKMIEINWIRKTVNECDFNLLNIK